MRPSANESKISAQFDFLDLEPDVEVECREEVRAEREYLVDARCGAERLADEDRIIRIDAPDQRRIACVQTAFVGVQQVLDLVVDECASS